jgi:hypothetical protein
MLLNKGTELLNFASPLLISRGGAVDFCFSTVDFTGWAVEFCFSTVEFTGRAVEFCSFTVDLMLVYC